MTLLVLVMSADLCRTDKKVREISHTAWGRKLIPTNVELQRMQFFYLNQDAGMKQFKLTDFPSLQKNASQNKF